MLDKKQVKSILVLGWQFFLHMFQKFILRKKSPGYDDFIEFYRADRIVPMGERDRERHPDFSKCVVCELCDPVCPVFNAAGSTRFAGPMDIASCLSRDLTESGAWPDPFLSTLCGACESACPENVPVSEIIVHLRRKTRITQPENLPNFYRDAIANLDNNKGVFGKLATASSDKKAPVLYWRGCREAQASNNTAELLKKLGVDFMTIDEVCCSGLPSELGLDYDSAPAAGRIRNSGATEIVTGCATCAKALKAALPDMEIKLAAEVAYKSKLPADKALEGEKVAIHDPCRMPRGAQTWDPPREIARSLGGEVVVLDREKETAPCCGAGGGLLEVDPDLAKSIARNRIEEVVSAGASVLVTPCELCARRLASAVSEGDKLKVKSLAEILI